MGDPLNSCCSCKLTSNAILRALFKYLTFTKCCGKFLSEEAHFGGSYWWSCVSLFMPPKTFLFISWQIIQNQPKLALHDYFIFCRTTTHNVASMYKKIPSPDWGAFCTLQILCNRACKSNRFATTIDKISSFSDLWDYLCKRTWKFSGEKLGNPIQLILLVPSTGIKQVQPTHKTAPASIVSSWVKVL